MTDDLDKAFSDMVCSLIRSDPLLVAIGRALAPKVNERIASVERQKPQPVTYCPGCGEPSSLAPDLCPECLEVENSAEQ